MAGKLQSYLRSCRWWHLLLAATVSGIVVGAVSVVLGLFCAILIEALAANGQQSTEAGDVVLAICVVLTCGPTGLIAGFSGAYGIARRRGYAALAITCNALGINILGLYVPTNGHALLPFYASTVIGLSLTMVFLILRPFRAES
jgi:hypothetical protein